MTYFDKIKALSIDEMAGFLRGTIRLSKELIEDTEELRDYILAWLSSEVEENEKSKM